MQEKDTAIVLNESANLTTQNTHETKAEVAMALTALDKIYKERIAAYAHELHNCTQKIEKLQSRLAELLEEKKPHSATLEKHQKDTDYSLRLLEKLTEDWTQKSLVIREIEHELSQLNHSDTEREKILQSRHKSLKDLGFEIEDTELLLLEHELQRQNTLLVMEPIEREITSVEREIKDLESEKRYIESVYLHQISPTTQNTNQALSYNK